LVLAELAWPPLAANAGAVVASLVLFMVVRRASRWLHRGLAIVAVGLLPVLFLVAAPVHDTTRPEGLVAKLGHRIITKLLDWDGDGHLEGFGGMDCAPHDPQIYPGAPEIPDNGRDEDCDGRDARQIVSMFPPRRQHALPSNWTAQPDVYLITIDTFARWALPTERQLATGSDDAGGTLPNLAEFATQSVVFSNFFVQGPSTRLSLPSIFTSRFDSEIARRVQGRFPFALLPNNYTLAEAMRDGGYATFAILPDPYFLPERWKGLLQGFDRVERGPALVAQAGEPHTARWVTQSALSLLHTPSNRPKFLWVHYFDAHSPHQAPNGTQSASERERYLAELGHIDHELGGL